MLTCDSQNNVMALNNFDTLRNMKLILGPFFMVMVINNVFFNTFDSPLTNTK